MAFKVEAAVFTDMINRCITISEIVPTCQLIRQFLETDLTTLTSYLYDACIVSQKIVP